LPPVRQLCENAENFSGKKSSQICGLASRLLKARHEDGLAGMDLVGRILRQVDRQLGCENWPRAFLAAVGFVEIIFTAL
jgi:hypothetical protein